MGTLSSPNTSQGNISAALSLCTVLNAALREFLLTAGMEDEIMAS